MKISAVCVDQGYVGLKKICFTMFVAVDFYCSGFLLHATPTEDSDASIEPAFASNRVSQTLSQQLLVLLIYRTKKPPLLLF